MKIQSISQNHYQNKNIGFGVTHRVIVHLPSCKGCDNLCVDAFQVARKTAYERALPYIEEIADGVNIQRGNQVEFIIPDKRIDPELASAIQRLGDDCEQATSVVEKDMLTIEQAKTAEGTRQLEIILTRDDINLALADMESAPGAVCELNGSGIEWEFPKQ